MVQLASETTYPESDVPGNFSNRTDYGGVQVQSYADHSFSQACGNQNFGPVAENGNFTEYGVSCNEAQTWTVHQ